MLDTHKYFCPVLRLHLYWNTGVNIFFKYGLIYIYLAITISETVNLKETKRVLNEMVI